MNRFRSMRLKKPKESQLYSEIEMIFIRKLI